MSRRSVRGATLIEVLIGSIIALLVGAALFQMLKTTSLSETTVLQQNSAIAAARTPIDVLAEHLRNAQAYPSDAYAAIQQGQQTDLTYYGSDAGDTVRYFLSGTDLRRTDSSGTVTAMGNVTALSFTYYKSNTYNSAGAPVQTTDPHVPTDAERPLLNAVLIEATVTTADGVARSYSTFVRLRNSPRKGRV